MKIHDEIENWMAGALCGALSPEEHQNFERHLAACPRCRSLYEEDQKMNDILKQTLPELRPDPNFERRVIAAFRERIARGWFHPWRGLVWVMGFRVAQAAIALLLLAALVAAMIAGGALISGERIPLVQNKGVDLLPATSIKSEGQSAATNVYWAGSQSGGTDSYNGFVAGAGNLGVNAQINGSGGFTTVGTGTVATGLNVTTGTGVLAGSNGYSGNWITRANWADGVGAPGANGTLSIGDTATFALGSAGALDLNGNSATVGSLSSSGAPAVRLPTSLGAPAIRNGSNVAGPVTVDQATSGAYSGAIREGAGGGNLTMTGSNIYRGLAVNGSLGKQSYTVTNKVVAADAGDSLVPGANGLSISASGTQGQNLYDARRIAANNNTAKGNFDGKRNDVQIEDAFSASGQRTFAINQLTLSGSISNAGGGGNPALHSGMSAALPPILDTRKLIRTATLDFEVANFDKALQTISGVASEEQGYIFTQNSGKAPDGKLQGEIVVKVAPANLDRFLLRVREIGDIKNETVSAQDVSKDYYDTESRMRNSQITEERMIDILKKRTGSVADLMEVEKEIADVRGEIEQMQGQLKYYDGLVRFATVTITLAEKGDVNQNAAWLLTEQAQLSLFSKDVEAAFTDAKNDAAAANAQTLESHMERDADGREVATLRLLLPPENADMAIAKMKAIGRIQTFTSQTQRVARNNGGSDTAKVERDKVELNLVIQHDLENAVQGTNISVQAEDVEEKTMQIKQEAAAAGVEVKGADFSRARNGAEISTMLLRMPMKKYPAFIEQIKSLGKVKDFTVGRRENASATEDAPAEIVLQIFNQAANPAVAATAPKITVHGTIGEGRSALMWSLRMIGVSLAFLLPWLVIGAVVASFIVIRRRMARKQG